MTYKLNARHLVLDLLYASKNSTLTIKRILAAAELLGISDNGIRVAVARLNQENVIQAVERGVYQLLEKKFDTSFISLNKHPDMQTATTWNGKYVYLDSAGKVLEISSSAPSAQPIIKGMNITTAKVGNTVVYKEAQKSNLFKQIAEAVQNTGFTGVTVIDVTDEYNLKFNSARGIYSKHFMSKILLPAFH